MESSSKSDTQRRIRRNREEWRARVARFEASGQTRERFCAEVGIGESTLRRWCSRLRERTSPAVYPADGYAPFLRWSVGPGAKPVGGGSDQRALVLPLSTAAVPRSRC